MSPTHLHFDSALGRRKPESILNREAVCPFCNIDALEEIIDQRDTMLLVKNKFQVLQGSFQTVLIESDQCDAELSTYEKPYLHQLISFAVEKWLEMEKSGEYRSVMMFKNHGHYSGGSIHHPHMQIIGFHEFNYLQYTSKQQFEGLLIDQKEGVELNVSTKPRAGFFEFNIILHEIFQLNQLADYIQVLVHYILNHFNQSCKSYNLFFYRMDEQIYVKVVPRFVTSPLFIGYSIPQVSTNLHTVIEDIKNKYFAIKVDKD